MYPRGSGNAIPLNIPTIGRTPDAKGGKVRVFGRNNELFHEFPQDFSTTISSRDSATASPARSSGGPARAWR